jgi:metal-responsive CopG/Arc/MetJ family transcriptional regulator
MSLLQELKEHELRKKQAKDADVHLRIPLPLYEAIEEFLADKDMSKSSLVRVAVIEYLERHTGGS